MIASKHDLMKLKQIKSILQSNQDQLISQETNEQLLLLPQTH